LRPGRLSLLNDLHRQFRFANSNFLVTSQPSLCYIPTAKRKGVLVAESPPNHPEQDDQRQGQPERKSAIEEQIGAPLRGLTSQIASLTNKISDNTDEEQRNRRKYEAEQLGWLKASTICSAISSALGFLVALATLVVLIFTMDVADKQRQITEGQLQEMKNQLKEMQATSTDTKNQVKNTEDLAKATKDLAKASSDQIKELKASVQATQGMVNSSREANTIAHGANDIAKLALQAAQRPWVGFSRRIVIRQPLTFESPAKGKSIALEFWIKNFGISVATATFPDPQVVLTVNHDEVIRVMKENCSRGVAYKVIGHYLFPGEENYRRLTMRDGNPRIGYDNNGMTQMWIVGCIFYRDHFDKLHKTEFAHSFFTDKETSLFKPEGVVRGELSPSIIGVTAD
jgi:hypothetical protein